MDILPLTHEQIKSDWDYFSKSIDAVVVKADGEMTPEQVYEAAIDHRVTVFHIIDEVKIGLLVLSDYEDDYTKQQVLHVDILYLTDGNLFDVYDLLEVVAKKYDFDKLAFSSTRRGWFKYLEAAGFKAAYSFSKEIV